MSRARVHAHAKPAKPAVAGWVVSLALLALLTVGALFVLDRVYHAEQFRIRAVEVRGHVTRVDGGQVRAVVERALPATYFSVELDDLEARIEQLPWVFSASLRRRWPDALVVEVTEVQPVAQWGDDRWLHSTGALVARPAEAHAAEWRDLPKLSGPSARAESRAAREKVWRAYQTWSKAFAAKGLQLDALHVDARGLCYLTLSVSALLGRAGQGAGAPSSPSPSSPSPPSIRLIVPQQHAAARIARFTGALRHPLLGDFAALRTVDLRYPNGFAVSRAAPAEPVTVSATTVATTPATAAAPSTPTHAEAH
ncbi:MAG: FtsQ-type POTRA domain-containing protein [Gammaproteobacteria bacterium]|nr:FtsQ-type POTRA domain-containing protein [Gammaproteobacteria bacterium]